MKRSADTIVVNATVEMTTASLRTVVAKAKQLAGRDQKGRYRVDTADVVNRMISRFLLEKDFESFVQNTENYKSIIAPGKMVC